jgi:hypothetical protein
VVPEDFRVTVGYSKSSQEMFVLVVRAELDSKGIADKDPSRLDTRKITFFMRELWSYLTEE